MGIRCFWIRAILQHTLRSQLQPLAAGDLKRSGARWKGLEGNTSQLLVVSVAMVKCLHQSLPQRVIMEERGYLLQKGGLDLSDVVSTVLGYIVKEAIF